MKLTAEERSAIRTLQRLQQRWPPSLWLFAGDGMLYVMRKTETGERMVKDDDCLDPAGIVERISGIEADGGGW